MEFQRIRLDNFKRKLFIKYELKLLLYKSIIKTTQIPHGYRYWALFNRTKNNRVGAKIQHTNLCFETGRARGVYTNTRYSRFKLRFENYAGNLPGFQKASW